MISVTSWSGRYRYPPRSSGGRDNGIITESNRANGMPSTSSIRPRGRTTVKRWLSPVTSAPFKALISTSARIVASPALTVMGTAIRLDPSRTISVG
jgi:hypothetical protein